MRRKLAKAQKQEEDEAEATEMRESRSASPSPTVPNPKMQLPPALRDRTARGDSPHPRGRRRVKIGKTQRRVFDSTKPVDGGQQVKDHKKRDADGKSQRKGKGKGKKSTKGKGKRKEAKTRR